jgi:calcineurin-like phosphoesterase family protein
MGTFKYPNGDGLWFTSDTHFFHRMMVEKFRNIPGVTTLDEHNEYLIRAWNSRVAPGDTVYHLGDICIARSGEVPQTLNILQHLNGKKFLVKGNHDHSKDLKILGAAFEDISNYAEIKVGDQHVILMHYPILSWHGVGRGSWHLHGHSHGNLPDDKSMARMDVGVDNHPDYAPFSYAEVERKLKNRTGRPGDHHY